MKRFFPRMKMSLCFLVLSALFLSSACDSSLGSDSSSDSDSEDTPVVSAADLAGTWLKKSFDPAYDYTEEGDLADALIIDITGSNYTMIFYYRTEQVGGNKGTFAVSGTNLVLSPTHSWNSEEYWTEDTEGFSIPFTYSTSTLTITGPGNKQISLVKTEFALNETLIRSWVGTGVDSEGLSLNSDGTYMYAIYSDPDVYENGPWTATSDLIRTEAIERDNTDVIGDGEPISKSFLIPYALSPDEIELTLTIVDPIVNTYFSGR